MKTIRVTVVEELTERTTIDIEVEDDFDLEDQDGLKDFFENAFTEGAYREAPNTKEYNIEERHFTDPEILP